MRRSILLQVVVHCPHFDRAVTATRNEAIDRLVACSDAHLCRDPAPPTDAGGRIRIDDLEMDPKVQARVSELWKAVTTENLTSVTDYAGFKHDFRVLFGFEVPGVDYATPVETEVLLAE